MHIEPYAMCNHGMYLDYVFVHVPRLGGNTSTVFNYGLCQSLFIMHYVWNMMIHLSMLNYIPL